MNLVIGKRAVSKIVFNAISSFWCVINRELNVEKCLTKGYRKVFSDIDSSISFAQSIYMIIPRRQGVRDLMFKMPDGGKEPGTSCKNYFTNR